MANEKNLKPVRSTEEARKRGRNGGIASGKSRREKRTLQNILNTILENDVENSPQFKEIAAKLGISGETSVKEFFTLVCLLNSISEGNLGDLERLTKLLGEETQPKNEGALPEILDAIRGLNND